MKIYPVNNNTVDVFLGEGWYNHARFKIKFNKSQGNQLFQIKGNRVPPSTMRELMTYYKDKQHA